MKSPSIERGASEEVKKMYFVLSTILSDVNLYISHASLFITIYWLHPSACVRVTLSLFFSVSTKYGIPDHDAPALGSRDSSCGCDAAVGRERWAAAGPSSLAAGAVANFPNQRAVISRPN
jgi:hypothetical protein